LDIATGAGDIPLVLWRTAKRRGWPVELAACDISPRAIEYARQQAKIAGARIEFFQQDVLAGDLPDRYDAILCSLFLHHLDDGTVQRLLARMMAAAGSVVVVSDLVRSPIALMTTIAATRVLTRSPVVRIDGPLSIRAAFTIDEIRVLAQAAGLADCTICRRWPLRFVLSWWRNDRTPSDNIER
jgi:2-polyprenyl-3-methyl-5-hydroxy-6-metoxy-1,4-benzoquinol methylase